MSLTGLIVSHVPLPSLPPSLTSYENGRTPFSTWTPVLLAIASYLAIIFGVQEVMHTRKAFKLTSVVQLHNLFLCTSSLLLLVLIVEEIVPIVYNHGIFYSICARSAWTPRLEFYLMINYYLKYVELLDTLLLALRKKPLAFLHVYHHSATAILCYAQMNDKPSSTWVPVTINLTVHVFMYYYYYATADGRRIWWKKYLTTMQIVQFMIDIVVLSIVGYCFLTWNYFPTFPSPGQCSGTLRFGILSSFIIPSYLFLFVSFYKDTYKNPRTSDNRPKMEKCTNGAGDGLGDTSAVKSKRI